MNIKETFLNEEQVKDLTNIRLNIIKKFNEIIDEDKSKIIEESCYQYVLNHLRNKNLLIFYNNNFKLIYMNKVIFIYNNLNPNSKVVKNTYLYKNVIENKIDLKTIANLKPEETFPDNWKSYINKKKAVTNFLYKENKYTITDEYRCSRCKKRKCTYYTMQTRSCDEPETIIITCLECHYTWKE